MNCFQALNHIYFFTNPLACSTQEMPKPEDIKLCEMPKFEDLF